MQKLYLAPMEGITTYVYRNAFSKYFGSIDKYYTPFLTASHLKGRELREVHPDNNKDIPLVPQILANESDQFLQIAEQLLALGYKEININLGCPSGTVVSKGRGSGFLNYPEKLDRFLDEVLNGLHQIDSAASLSVKTRIGYEFISEWDDILEVYKKYPLSELIIHPRLRNEFYTGDIHMDAFQKAAEEIPSETDLCYNGDIIDAKTFTEKCSSFDNTPVMIGRGVIRNPLLPKSIKDFLSTGIEEQSSIDSSEKKRLSSFLNELVENYRDEMSNDRQVVMKMKELWTYLSMGLEIDKKQLKLIHKANSLTEYKTVQQMILSGLFYES